MGMGASEKQVLHEELAKLLEAGFGIRQAIAVILETSPPRAQADLLRAMDAGLAKGRTIAEAFAEGGADGLELSMVRAGERGGRLAQAFRHLADYFSLLAKARNGAIRAMIYPLVVLHMGVFLAVVPGGLLAQRSWGEIGVSLVLALVGLYAGLAVLSWVVRMILRMAPDRAGMDRWLGRIPVVGKARRSLAMARFTKVYHTGVLAGISMRETVGNALEASGSGVMREGGRPLLAIAEEGGALGPEFVRCGVFPQVFARSYATAEEAGGLDKDLERWAKFYQEEAERGAEAVGIVLPKVCYALILLFVAWKIVGFYSGYYEMLESIGE